MPIDKFRSRLADALLNGFFSIGWWYNDHCLKELEILFQGQFKLRGIREGRLNLNAHNTQVVSALQKLGNRLSRDAKMLRNVLLRQLIFIIKGRHSNE